VSAEVKVRVKDVSHRYGELAVHDRLDFGVRDNEFLCICGPSGCGKSTLLDILAGILRPTAGEVLIHGDPVDPKRQNIAFVFQEPSTLPWLNVWNNIAVGLRIKKRPEPEIRRIVDDIIALVGLGGAEKQYPHQLSGGMKQRVGIARAFATDADVILMDEPFVSLDQPTRERMQREVLDIWEHRKRTIIFVTHNLEEAAYLGDRILVLSAKPARIVADIPNALPRPRDLLSKEFTELRSRCAAILNELSRPGAPERATG
jgi:ABC-type nitrate/sulfonate/bicarbonate transport system ATPase subunit